MKLTIYHIDAFTNKVFQGNPAAVIPLKEWLAPELMQRIAMENNLSETAFIVPDGSDGEGRYSIRWFTPLNEMDLCGHATLASAYVIKNFLEPQVKEMRFSTQSAGNLKCAVNEGMFTLDFPSRPPMPAGSTKGIAEALGTSTIIEILRSRDYFVVLPDEDAVRNLEPDFEKMKALDAFGLIATAKGRTADVVSRCFYPKAGISEDPVTGSAHCNIVPYWSEKLAKKELHCVQASLRGGTLLCELRGDRVMMSGNCVLYMQGEIDL